MGFYDKIVKCKGIPSVDELLIIQKYEYPPGYKKSVDKTKQEYLKTKANPNNVDLSWYFRLIK